MVVPYKVDSQNHKLTLRDDSRKTETEKAQYSFQKKTGGSEKCAQTAQCTQWTGMVLTV